MLHTALADVVRALVHASHLRGCQLRHATALFGDIGSLSRARRHHVRRPPRLDGVLDAFENTSVTVHEREREREREREEREGGPFALSV